MHERELISLYISGISKKVKSYWPMYHNNMIHCSIYATFLFLNFGDLSWLIKPISGQMVSTGMIYSNCPTS